MAATLRVPVRAVRRMAIAAQRLDGPAPRRRPDEAAVREIAEALACLQLDPTSVVARSHLLVLRSRLGDVDPATVDRVAYEQRALFEYWAHEASYVCTSDLAIHTRLMRSWPDSESAWARRSAAWLEGNDEFRRHVLERLAADGPLPAAAIEDRAAVRHHSTGWTPGDRTVGRMLDLLWMRGEIGVARREGGKRLWDLGERCLPPGALDAVEEIDEREAVTRAALRSLRALGVARIPHIRAHFTRHRYTGLPEILDDLAARGEVVRVEVEGLGADWWACAQDVERLRALAGGPLPWRPRTILLSPFDNLICDRARTELLWGFFHRLEIYVPRAKRRWGYFVLPILHGDRLIGRADLAVDARAGVLHVHSVFAEPGTARLGAGVRRELERLARWRGVPSVAFSDPDGVPAGWRGSLLGAA